MAKCIVDGLEAIQIQHQQSAIARLSGRTGHSIFQRPQHLYAIGEPGERIELGKALYLGLAPAHFGKVGATPAKAVELAKFVENRLAGYRPPALVTRCGRANMNVRKAGARREMEAEGALTPAILMITRRDNGGDRAPDKFVLGNIQCSRERFG